ncbi:OLC1v1033881C1 [Oldenlandia corymbosa var. corymbosa]|uniref:OLC1v1033881C1 n=1 Tax=Oldenlandia corymbosa var. corymbosa TaxID=529605 RepID=A0AAV1CPD5_OLDCO|nr:OLC1v1033881C1 [Oldenlandia corymbosa var. corymbosa]
MCQHTRYLKKPEEKLGETLGKVHNVLIPDVGGSEYRHIKVLVDIDLRKQLERGTLLEYKGKEVRVLFKYENLGEFGSWLRAGYWKKEEKEVLDETKEERSDAGIDSLGLGVRGEKSRSNSKLGIKNSMGSEEGIIRVERVRKGIKLGEEGDSRWMNGVSQSLETNQIRDHQVSQEVETSKSAAKYVTGKREVEKPARVEAGVSKWSEVVKRNINSEVRFFLESEPSGGNKMAGEGPSRGITSVDCLEKALAAGKGLKSSDAGGRNRKGQWKKKARQVKKDSGEKRKGKEVVMGELTGKRIREGSTVSSPQRTDDQKRRKVTNSTVEMCGDGVNDMDTIMGDQGLEAKAIGGTEGKKGRWGVRWFMGGDFSDIREVGEKKGGRMRNASSCMEEVEIEEFGKAKVTHVDRLASDHCLFFLDTDPGSLKRKSRFYFDKGWVAKNEINEIVKKAWETEVEGSPMHKLSLKIKICRLELLKWNGQQGLNSSKEIQRISKELETMKEQGVEVRRERDLSSQLRKVNQLIDPIAKSWRREMLNEILIPSEVELVMEIPLSKHGSKDTQRVWELAPVRWDGLRFRGQRFADWWGALMKIEDGTEIDARIEISVYLLWQIWKARNSWQYEETKIEAFEVVRRAIAEWTEFKQVQKARQRVQNIGRREENNKDGWLQSKGKSN